MGLSHNEDGTVSLSIYVAEEARGQGLQNIMYAKMIEIYPGIKGVRHYLMESNQEIYYKVLINEMKNKKLTSSRRINGIEFDTYEQEFNFCCLAKFLSRSPEERKQLALHALKETPAHRSSSSIGFSNICKMQFTGDDPVPEFISCK